MAERSIFLLKVLDQNKTSVHILSMLSLLYSHKCIYICTLSNTSPNECTATIHSYQGPKAPTGKGRLGDL